MILPKSELFKEIWSFSIHMNSAIFENSRYVLDQEIIWQIL